MAQQDQTDDNFLSPDYQDPNEVPASPLSVATNASNRGLPGGASPLSDSNITDLLLKKAQQTETPRPEVLAKRQALQDAYQKLITAQQYIKPPEDESAYKQAFAMANVPVPGGGINSNLMSGIAGNLARAEEEQNQQNLQRKSLQDQASTGIAAANEANKEVAGDTENSNELLKQAGLTEYRNAMMGARLNKPVKLPDGSQAIVNSSTGEVKPIIDKFGNPISQNGGTNSASGQQIVPGVNPEKANLASNLGVPVAPDSADPTRGMTPQGRSTYTNKLQTQLQKNGETNQQIQDQLGNIDHFIDENANNKSGGWRNLPVVSSILNASDPGYQTMNSMNKQFSVGPGMRPQGMRVTQGEWQVFRQAVQSTSNTQEANLNIANAMKAKLQRDLDYNNFMNDYTAVNGHSQLAENYFNQYMKDNPIFSKDANSKNNFQLNPNRQSYQDYFAQKGLTGVLPASSQNNPNPTNAPDVAAAAKNQNSSIQNNNPGNVRNGPNGSFAPAATPEDGIATTAGNLLAYQSKHGINTINGIVPRWAPPVDSVTGKPNDVKAYIADVAKTTGFAPDQPLNFNDPKTLYALTSAIIKHENGNVPYHPMQLSQGVQMALNNSKKDRLANASPQDIADALKAQGVIK